MDSHSTHDNFIGQELCNTGDRAYVIAKASKIISSKPTGRAVMVEQPGLLGPTGEPLTDTQVVEVDFVNSGRTPTKDVVIVSYFDTPFRKILKTPYYSSESPKQLPGKGHGV